MKSRRAKLSNRPDALDEHLLSELGDPLVTALQIVVQVRLRSEARGDHHHRMPGQAGDRSDQTSQRSFVVARVVEDRVDLCRDVPIDAVGVRPYELCRRPERSLRGIAFHVLIPHHSGIG